MPLLEKDHRIPFERSVYRDRLGTVKDLMSDRGLDALLLTDPTSHHYLSGFESRSWSSFQVLLVLSDRDEPIFSGRQTEERAGHVTTWLRSESVRCYPESYAHPHSPNHPVEWVLQLLDEHGDYPDVGVETGSDFLPADTYAELQRRGSSKVFHDVTQPIRGLYHRKSDGELDYMREAGKITDRAMYTAVDSIGEGVRENDAMAAILQTLVEGTEEYGGLNPEGSPSFGPGHFRFSDRKFEEGDVFKLELSGCVHYYYKPLTRTFHIGEPPRTVRRIYEELDEDLELLISSIEPGKKCGEIDRIYREEANHPTPTRCGYSSGYSVAPTWGEGSADLTEGDETVLEPGMTFHFVPRVPDIGPDKYEMLHSEQIVVTENGCEIIGNFPRKLLVV